MTPRRAQVLTSKREPLIDAAELARANRAWITQEFQRIPCGVPAPPNYRPGMPADEIWRWHRQQESVNKM